IEAERVAAVAAEGLAQHGEVGLGLRQAVVARLPRGATVSGLVDAHLAVWGHPIGVRFERDDEGAVGVVRIDGEREAEVGGKPSIGADVEPGLAGVVRPVGAAVELHIERRWLARRASQAVDAEDWRALARLL